MSMRSLIFLTALMAGAASLPGCAPITTQPEQTSLEARAAGGDPWAMMQLGHRYEQGLGVTADPEQAFGWYRRAADTGLADAQYQIGLMYELGIGVEANIHEAEAWYGRAVGQGFCPSELRDPADI